MKVLVVSSGFFLFILFLRFFTFYNSQHLYKPGEAVFFKHTFLDEPKTTSIGQTFRIATLIVSTTRYPEYHYGDTVVIKGKVTLNTHGQLAINNAKVSPEKSINTKLLAPLSWVRQRIVHTFQTYLSSQNASLLLGIVFGIKVSFDPDFYNALKNTGVLHVIAASGMNVSMVAEFLLVLLLPLFPRRIALGIAILGITLYAFLSGLQASIVRASLMAIAAFSAQVIGRQYTAFYVLALVAGIMLLINPLQISDVGFQLSFASTLGILLIKPLLDTLHLLKRLEEHIFLFEDFATTLAAQLATIPLFFITFGTYSPLSILVNLLVLWTIPFLMILGGVGAIVALIFPSLSSVFLYLCLPLLWYFEWVVITFSHFSPPFTLENLPIMIWIGYYLIGLAIVFFLSEKK